MDSVSSKLDERERLFSGAEVQRITRKAYLRSRVKPNEKIFVDGTIVLCNVNAWGIE